MTDTGRGADSTPIPRTKSRRPRYSNLSYRRTLGTVTVHFSPPNRPPLVSSPPSPKVRAENTKRQERTDGLAITGNNMLYYEKQFTILQIMAQKRTCRIHVPFDRGNKVTRERTEGEQDSLKGSFPCKSSPLSRLAPHDRSVSSAVPSLSCARSLLTSALVFVPGATRHPLLP